MTEVKIKENSWLARLAAFNLKADNVALVMGKTIHLFGVQRHDFLNNASWVRHELKHVEQVKQLGLIRFLWCYLVESMRHGYFNNKYEREAREAEHDLEIASRFQFKNQTDNIA